MGQYCENCIHYLDSEAHKGICKYLTHSITKGEDSEVQIIINGNNGIENLAYTSAEAQVWVGSSYGCNRFVSKI